MRRDIKIIIVATLVSLVSNLCFCENDKQLSKEEIFRIFEGKLKELNLPGVDLDKIKYSSFSSQLFDNTTEYVGCLGVAADMKIESASGRILHIFNDAAKKEIKKPLTSKNQSLSKTKKR